MSGVGFDDYLSRELQEIEAAGLLRKLRVVRSCDGRTVELNGREIRNFSSNDYLGMSLNAAVLKAAGDEIARSGSGSGASRLICGTLHAHEALEATLADFKGTEAALGFSSGYAAALGTIPALMGEKDVIILDKLCHACLVDGARLSGAILRVFPHNDLAALESRLAWAAKNHPDARVLILAESVYSMDGDLAPLREIVDLKEKFGAWLMLDEAHGVGVFGSAGRGLADAVGVADRVEIQMGTLGKALGSSGAYICGNQLLRDFLINRARSFIFSTAPTPASAAAATAAIQILKNPITGEPLLKALHDNIRRLSGLLDGMGVSGVSPILPIVLGAESRAVQVSANLLERGFLVPAIRYPTVARGSARLRVTLSAAHIQADIEALADVLASEAINSGMPDRTG